MQQEWQRLEIEAARLKDISLRTLFQFSQRVEGLSASMGSLRLDFSREKIDRAALSVLLRLAQISGVEMRRDAMFRGEVINTTEQRAVLHMALRGGVSSQLAGQGVVDSVKNVLEQFLDFAEAVRAGHYAAIDGEPFTDVVNLGIGGSDLGPAMATQALAPDHDGPRLHYVSNVDGAHIGDTLKQLDPKRTLVIIASKTFTTIETMTNAATARAWLQAALGAQTGHHLAAVSTNIAAAAEMGIAEERVFGFWDWVGGRYSIWSAIGLPLAIAIGADRFRAFLAGAAEMDRHFCEAELSDNLPVLLGLIGIWRRNFMGYPSVCIAPYDQRLARFPAYLQQLEMESNGKQVRLDGSPVKAETGALIWGEAGTNAQHSYFQLLHQGTDIIPVDFLLAAQPRSADLGHHHLLVANCLAQAQALAFGRTEAEARAAMKDLPLKKQDRLAPHRSFAGDRPSTMLLYPQLDPAMLGRLIALYEHKVFVQSVIWDINAFDQWGVELGKALAKTLEPAVKGAQIETDAATLAALAYLSEQSS